MPVAATDLTLRPIEPADLPGAIELVRTTLAEFDLAFGDGSETDLQMLALPDSYTRAGGAFWVAVQPDGAVVGTCGVYPVAEATFELRKMYLDPRTRGTGVGRRLLALAVAFAREQGARQLVLDTTEQMTAAIAFYETNGFVRDDRQIRGARCSRGYVLALALGAVQGSGIDM